MKKVLIAIGVILIVGLGIFGYKKISPTKIAFINYPDFLYAKVSTSNDNGFIKIDNLKPDSLPNLNSYDMLIIFGMGINLPAEQAQKIKEAGEKGVNIFLQASTNPNMKFTNIVGEQLDNINAYLDNGGRKNYKNMLNYIRVNIDHKTFKTDSIIPAQEIPNDVLFYTDEDAIFPSVKEFEEYCNNNGFHKQGQKKVIVFTSIPGPFNANREHMNSLIEELQSRNLNVYPVAGFAGRLNYIKQINPNLIVYMPHGRLSMGGSAKMIAQQLKQLNVPILCPVSVFMEYDKWLKNKMGMFGGLLSQSVTMPEFDGGIVAYATFAQFKDKNGLLLFKAIPNRLKKFGDIAENYLSLSEKPNKDKKLAIVYFKGPGKNALVASNMEVLPSLHNNLLMLKNKGYNLGDLPTDYKQFEKRIMTEGPVLGAYAEGAFDKFLKNGNPKLVNVNDYRKWCNEILPTELYDEVVKRYGKAPGSYMAVYKDTAEYIAIAAVHFGNVTVLPQPLPGLGSNEFSLVHGAKVAPPHTYIAPYVWIQKGLKADAIFHFGTHGSLEFTPGKQIALSDYDWTDPLIGTTPHFYIYTISNVGEGMIAKRRSYAVTQTYLTPSFMEAEASNIGNSLHNKIHKYETATGALKTQYALAIKKIVMDKGYHKDLGLDSIPNKPYNEDEMMRLSNYIEEIEHDKITGGLYTMGVPYPKNKIKETVELITNDALAYKLADIDIIKGKISADKIKDKRFFNNKYKKPCVKYIEQCRNPQNVDKVFAKLVSSADFQRATKWRSTHKKTRGGGMGMMMSMKASKKKKFDKTIPATDKEKAELKQLIIKIIPNEEQRKFVERLNSKKEYEQTLTMLDPKTLEKVKSMAKLIPAMKKAVDIALTPTVHRLLVLIQKEELYQLTKDYLKDNKLEQEIAIEKHRQDSLLLNKALSDKYMVITKLESKAINKFDIPTATSYKQITDFYSSKKQQLIGLLQENTNDKTKQLNDFLTNKLDKTSAQVGNKLISLKNTEEEFCNAVFSIKKTLASVKTKEDELANSPQSEFEAIINSLNGGYTPTSEGGDPISNPNTVPTGRNLVSISAEKTPSKEAWEVGKKLADQLLADFKKKHNKYPEKVSFTLWSSSFIESEGTTIAQILYLLGVEPVWSAFGNVRDIRLIPEEKLNRPRIDVVVQTSGQLRDLAASRLFLINRAIAKAAAEGNENNNNFVSKGAVDAEKRLIEKGFSPKQARELSTKRVFGGVNGNYGAGIMGMVESSDRWDSTKAVAQTYINNMGALYVDENSWGEFDAGVFEAALLNTEAVVQPRQSNTWGALSLDHVYEFMGGLNLAVREVTGNDAESYFNDFRNHNNPRVQGLHEAIWVESRTTLLNPKYIKEYMKGGASSAETFAETFRNTFGWNVMKPSVIENRLWDELYDTYVEDKQNLGVHKFFEKENPYALQEMTAVMLETVRKGMWKATPEQIKNMAELHGKLVKEHEAGCSGFVCDNQKLKAFISKQLDKDLQQAYNKEIDNVREVSKEASKENVVLKKEEKIQPKQQAESTFSTNKTLLLAFSEVILLLLLMFVIRRRKK